jgi:hypothetical protein
VAAAALATTGVAAMTTAAPAASPGTVARRKAKAHSVVRKKAQSVMRRTKATAKNTAGKRCAAPG